ncbi:MAG: 50S ribosomal protein L1 [Verrucomicrobiales bacterium]|nr:50S ribosomal protein L1 [Verrucomicrobiales bacterium]
MPKKRSKRYQEAAKLVDSTKLYSLAEAMELVKKFPGVKFDQTVTISFKMGVDPRQSDQMVRGTCPLPHGSGKDVTVLVFAEGEAATAARNAGAEFVGYEEMIKKVQEGWLGFDVVIATPSAMAEVRKLGRQLGPRGLMPNPKTGTVTDDTAEAVKAVKAGRVDFKLDRNANISVPVGKASFEPQQLVENAAAVIDSVMGAKPASAKGNYLTAGAVAATMTPGVRIDLGPFR